jgi:hypothetical protein
VTAVEFVILSNMVVSGNEDASLSTSSSGPIQKTNATKIAKPALPLMSVVRIIEYGITVAAFSISSARTW